MFWGFRLLKKRFLVERIKEDLISALGKKGILVSNMELKVAQNNMRMIFSIKGKKYNRIVD